MYILHITYRLNRARCLPRDQHGLGLGHIFDGRALDTSVRIPGGMHTAEQVLARSKHAELIGGRVEFHVQLAPSYPPWFQKGFRGAFHVPFTRQTLSRPYLYLLNTLTNALLDDATES